MLSNWRVSNFKSVRDTTELDLGPITIFAGNNSSGKSTLLQSILLISQTLSSKVSSKSVVLNGNLTKLGQFADLKANNSRENYISIGWTSNPFPLSQLRSSGNYVSGRLPLPPAYIREISCDISFDVDQKQQIELRQLQPRLLESSLITSFLDPLGTISSLQLVAKRRKKRNIKIVQENSLTKRTLQYSFDDQERAKDFAVELDKEFLFSLKETHNTGEVVGCLFRHFLPEQLLIRYDEKEEETEFYKAILYQKEFSVKNITLKNRQFRLQRELIEKPIPEPLITLLKMNLGEEFINLLRPNSNRSIDNDQIKIQDLTAYEWLLRVEKLTSERRAKLYDLLDSIDGEITKAINPNNKKNWVQDTNRIPTRLEASVQYLDSFFTSSVKYLGPLRDEPKPLYPLAATADPSDVGLRGEYTAAVLDIYKNQTINYIPTSYFKSAEIKGSLNEEVTLAFAVQDWLQYLNIAQEFQTKDLGKLGHELKVVLEGAKTWHDLTHVGVGVSQVLPILVTCLLAERDTTLIFEQPELHLHPKVQTLLGDFFLSMAFLGKQCIIETHSEYLINRLRFRIAAESGKNLPDLIKMYFVEKKEGTSVFNKVEISEYGAIENWPEGFFDQSQEEAERILRAAAMKRRAELKKNG